MMNVLKVDAVKTNPEVELPTYTRLGDGALDLRSQCNALIEPGSYTKIPCGIKIAIPEGYVGLVLPRSGLACNFGVTVLNAPGLIDSNFRGEINVTLINHNKSDKFKITKGDRIAQLLIVEARPIQLNQVTSLSETNRGECGFGSSGLN